MNPLYIALILAGYMFAGASADITIKMGSDTGDLVFVPSTASISSGAKVKFKNNAGYPHSVTFDEDNVPAGVNAAAISSEGLIDGAGTEYEVTLNTPGTYGYFCDPHQGGGMKGTIYVQ